LVLVLFCWRESDPRCSCIVQNPRHLTGVQEMLAAWKTASDGHHTNIHPKLVFPAWPLLTIQWCSRKTSKKGRDSTRSFRNVWTATDF
jgi:hypothetical protein